MIYDRKQNSPPLFSSPGIKLAIKTGIVQNSKQLHSFLQFIVPGIIYLVLHSLLLPGVTYLLLLCFKCYSS